MKTRMLTFTGWIAAFVLAVAFCVALNSAQHSPAVGQATDSGFQEALPALPSNTVRYAAVNPVPTDINSLVGEWSYKVGKKQFHEVQLTIGPKTIDGSLTFPEEASFDVKFHAEYTRSDEGILYGIVHCVDINFEESPAEDEEQYEAKLFASRLVEQPFALRFHIHDSALMVKDVKLGIGCALVDDEDELGKLTRLFIGRFTRSMPNTAPQLVPQQFAPPATVMPGPTFGPPNSSS